MRCSAGDCRDVVVTDIDNTTWTTKWDIHNRHGDTQSDIHTHNEALAQVSHNIKHCD